MFLLFVQIIRLFYREVRLISKVHVSVFCSRHEIAETLLKFALNTNQSINQSSDI